MANNWVYFIYDPATKQVKIGQSWNPVQRLTSIKGHGHNKAEIIAIIPAHSVERELHELFASHRQEGEWFELSDELREYIQETQKLPPIIIKEVTETAPVRIVERTELQPIINYSLPATPGPIEVPIPVPAVYTRHRRDSHAYVGLAFGLLHFAGAIFIIGGAIGSGHPVWNLRSVGGLAMIVFAGTVLVGAFIAQPYIWPVVYAVRETMSLPTAPVIQSTYDKQEHA